MTDQTSCVLLNKIVRHHHWVNKKNVYTPLGKAPRNWRRVAFEQKGKM